MTVFSAPTRRSARLSSGFTLIELMITVAIIAILSAMALFAYGGYVARARRADARNQLLQAAQFMQQFYSANDSFSTDRTNHAVAIPTILAQSPADSTPIYTLSFAVGMPTVLSYQLVMTPVTSGPMASDSCGAFTITATGVRGITSGGTPGTPAQRDICWK